MLLENIFLCSLYFYFTTCKTFHAEKHGVPGITVDKYGNSSTVMVTMTVSAEQPNVSTTRYDVNLCEGREKEIIIKC